MKVILILSALLITNSFGDYCPFIDVSDNNARGAVMRDHLLRGGDLPMYCYGGETSPYLQKTVKKQLTAAQQKAARIASIEKAKQKRLAFYQAQKNR